MQEPKEASRMTTQKRFSVWGFLLSLPLPALIFCWLGWSIAEGEFRLPSPRPSMRLPPVRPHSEPFQFLFWTVLLAGLGLYCLYPAFCELRRLFKRPDRIPPETEEADGVVNAERSVSASETIVSESVEITVTDPDTGEERTYDSIDDLPPDLRRLLKDNQES